MSDIHFTNYSTTIMINFEIIAAPTTGKKIELEQSIASIQKKLQKLSPLFEVKIKDECNYHFLFKLETEEKVERLFKNKSFVLLTGAIRTLCNKPLVTLNGKNFTLRKFN